MSATQTPTRPARSPFSRAGYVVAAALDLVMLVIVNSLAGWGWPPFLTDDFARVLPLMNLSIAADAAANVFYLVNDDGRIRSLGKLVLGGLSLVVLSRIWQVFPFDFSAYQGFDWDLLARLVLVVAMVGTGIGMLVEFTKWLTGRS